MSMTAVELAEQRWMDRRRERTCVGCPEHGVHRKVKTSFIRKNGYIEKGEAK